MAKEMIFSSAKKTVYRDGDTAIKEFCEGFPKAEVLNEALCNARVDNANDGDRSIFSFIRKDETGKKNLLFVVNFTPVDRPDYRVGVPKRCKLSLLLDNVHGAYKPSQCPTYTSVKSECDGQPYSISYPLGGYGTAIFRF